MTLAMFTSLENIPNFILELKIVVSGKAMLSTHWFINCVSMLSYPAIVFNLIFGVTLIISAQVVSYMTMLFGN